MIFITHLISHEPEGLAGPLLADTYVTLLKGRNAWYGLQLASGKLRPEDGDVVPGKGLIQVMLPRTFHLRRLRGMPLMAGSPPELCNMELARCLI